MLNSSSSTLATSSASAFRSITLGETENVEMLTRQQFADHSFQTVDIAPRNVVARRALRWIGMGAETIKVPAHHRVDCRFRSPLHLLVAYEQGERRSGESSVEGLLPSSLRDVARKLTLVPAGHGFHEWHNPHTAVNVTCLYFDPAQLRAVSGQSIADLSLRPRLFFDEAPIWSTMSRLGKVIDATDQANDLYIDALLVVLLHELVNLERRARRAAAPIKGGLATWQQRIVADYIEEHLFEQISLATLARLARLSRFHFCRAFKQSFDVSPHRYHTSRRVARARVLLADRHHSVTEVGQVLGFSEPSSFTAMFRKFTGQTPSGYRRALG